MYMYIFRNESSVQHVLPDLLKLLTFICQESRLLLLKCSGIGDPTLLVLSNGTPALMFQPDGGITVEKFLGCFNQMGDHS